MNIRRGEIYLAALDPVVGIEITKTRTLDVFKALFNLLAFPGDE